MAFDPLYEDCMRLILEAMRREHIYPLEDAAFVARQTDVYTADPARLIRTDRNRSFHLVARATELIDYRIPFLTDESEMDACADEAEGYLREAAELDPTNWDAKRMLAALEAESNEAYVRYLHERLDEVKRDFDALDTAAADPYDREFAVDLGRRPYLRWLAALASRSLIAGRYRQTLRIAEESLTLAPQDPADIRHTAMLALAKLEVEPDELVRFRAQHAAAYLPPAWHHARRPKAAAKLDAWSLLAHLSLAYRAFDLKRATAILRDIVRAYPQAAQALFYQTEFPDGVYARVHVMPGSDDELILALSEATPLLQEGVGTTERADFSLWISQHELVQSALRSGEGDKPLDSSPDMLRRGGDN